MKKNERIEEDMQPTFPGKEIPCRTCLYRMGGIVGYKSGYCERYPEGAGKPNAVLFNSADCPKYERGKDGG